MNKINIPWPGVKASTFFTDSEKRTFEVMCTKYKVSGMLNESILSRMRTGLDNLRKAGGAEMDEMMIDKLQEIMMSSGKFANYLNQHFDKTYDKVLGYYKKGLDKPKIELKRKIKSGKFDYPKDNIDREIADLTKMSVFWLKDFKKILSEQTTTKYSKCLIAEAMTNSADLMMVLEGFDPKKISTDTGTNDTWSFLDAANAAITSTEPFASIMETADLTKNMSNSSLNKFAEITNRIGGPKCKKLSGLGSIAGKLASMRETTATAEGIMKTDPILRFLPTGKALIEAFEMIAFVVTVLDLISELKNEK